MQPSRPPPNPAPSPYTTLFRSRFHLRRASVKLECAPRRQRRELGPEVASSQIEIVGVDIPRLPPCQSIQPFGRQPHLDLLCNCRAQLPLELKHAARFTVVGRGPDQNLVG